METYKWAWFRRYCTAARVAKALINRQELPEVKRLKLQAKKMTH